LHRSDEDAEGDETAGADEQPLREEIMDERRADAGDADEEIRAGLHDIGTAHGASRTCASSALMRFFERSSCTFWIVRGSVTSTEVTPAA
jgi:hypothetical protein